MGIKRLFIVLNAPTGNHTYNKVSANVLGVQMNEWTTEAENDTV